MCTYHQHALEGIDTPPDARFFWTDSTTVLKYLSNDQVRYKIFVTNRVQTIQDSTELNEWHYVNSEQNPADRTSRGIKIPSFIQETTWIDAPTFLWNPIEQWPESPKDVSSNKQDILDIVSTQFITTITVEKNDILRRFTRFSSWHLLKKVVARLLHLRNDRPWPSLVKRKKSRTNIPCPIKVEEMEKAETAILEMVQFSSFPAELAA